MKKISKFLTTMLVVPLVFGMTNTKDVSAAKKTVYFPTESVIKNYDEDGNVSSVRTNKSTYDKKGRLIKFVSTDEDEDTTTDTYTYWKNGKIKTSKSVNVSEESSYTTETKYDKHGNITYQMYLYESKTYDYIYKDITNTKNTYKNNKLVKQVSTSKNYSTDYNEEGDLSLKLQGKGTSTTKYKYKGKLLKSSDSSYKNYQLSADGEKFRIITSGTSKEKRNIKKGVTRKDVSENVINEYNDEEEICNTTKYKYVNTFDVKGKPLKYESYQNDELTGLTTRKYAKNKCLKVEDYKNYFEGNVTSECVTKYYTSGKYKGLVKEDVLTEDSETTKYTYKYKLNKNKKIQKESKYKGKKLMYETTYKYKKFKIKK